MIRDEKLLKDRKILRKIDLNLAQQSRYLVAANILVFLFVATVGGFYRAHPQVTLVFGCALLLFSAVSFYQSVRFDAIYGAGPARWRSVFLFVQLALALVMGAYAAAVSLSEPLSVNAFLLALYLVVYSSMNNVEWSPYHQWNLGRHLLALVPPIAGYVVIVNVNGMTIAVALLVLLIMLIRQSRLMNVRHWDNVRTHHELHTKARDLAHAVNEANNASQIKTEFLANITHEIRTPMNNVLGMLALLDDTDLSDQQKELQKVAVHSGEALLSLIDDILDFSRIASGQVKLDEGVFNLKKCIDQTLDLLGPRAHEKGLELSCMYADDLPVRVKGDQQRLAQLISNLVSNAIKYSAGSDISVTVQMARLSESEGELRVDVRDNGKGIDPALQERLFEAFSKNLSRNDYTEAGTGLGLAISKGLAECMQGTIGFSSEQDKGTLFWFTARLRLSTQQAQKALHFKELMNVRVLMVDVEGGLRTALQAEMLPWQPDIVFASSQCNVLDTLLAAQRTGQPFSLLVLNLPVKQATSFELCRAVREQPELRRLHILVLSSLAQRADASRLRLAELEQVEWLSKPVTRDKLCRALIQSFELHNLEADFLDRASADDSTVLEGRSILLVEDNAVSQMVARGMLNKLGYTVACVSNGKEALGFLEERPVDLILMDCLMPVMDGYETTREWRDIEKARGGHIPIVAMTASVVEGEQQRCLLAGMDDYLSKPVNIEELSAKMRQWLGGTAEATAALELDDGATPEDKQSRKTA